LPASPNRGTGQNTENPLAVEREFGRPGGIAGKLGVFDEFRSFRIVGSIVENLASVAKHTRQSRILTGEPLPQKLSPANCR
jgi:hypothetical protein